MKKLLTLFFCVFMYFHSFGQTSVNINSAVQTVCSGTQVTVNSGLSGTVDSFLWKTSNDSLLIVQSATAQAVSFKTGLPGESSMDVTVFYTAFNGSTSHSDSLTLTVEAAPLIELPDDEHICRVPGQSAVRQVISIVKAENIPNSIQWHLTGFKGAKISAYTNYGDSIGFDLSMPNDSTHLFIIGASSGITAGYCPPASDMMILYLHPVPDASVSATPLEGCLPLELNMRCIFNNKITHPSYEWSTANGDSGTDSTFSTWYTQAGNYNNSVKLSSEYGCDTTLVFYNATFSIPQARFSPDPDNVASIGSPTFDFTNLSIVDGSSHGIKRSHWDFGVPDTETDTANTFHSTFTYSDTGIYLVTLFVVTENGCRDSFSYSVHVEPLPPTQDDALFIAYPNPASHSMVIASNTKLYDGKDVAIYDSHGRLVKQEKIKGYGVKIDISDLKPAIYHVRVDTNEQRTIRFVKIN